MFVYCRDLSVRPDLEWGGVLLRMVFAELSITSAKSWAMTREAPIAAARGQHKMRPPSSVETAPLLKLKGYKTTLVIGWVAMHTNLTIYSTMIIKSGVHTIPYTLMIFSYAVHAACRWMRLRKTLFRLVQLRHWSCCVCISGYSRWRSVLVLPRLPL